ncbi:hypothetical protein IG631_04313 [Alternaria alternata]|nr:hypothetical protein IG631_04313 [Alternaria alternata]
MEEPSCVSSCWFSMMCVCFVVSRHRRVSYSCASTRNTGDSAGVQVFQQQSECTRSGDGCERLSDPLRRPLRLTGDGRCFPALGAGGLKRCCRVLLLPFPTANQHGTLHTTDGKAIRHRRIIDEHTKRQTSTWATCSRQSVVRSIVVA